MKAFSKSNSKGVPSLSYVVENIRRWPRKLKRDDTLVGICAEIEFLDLSFKIQMLVDSWKHKAKELKREIHAVYLAMKDPRTPWYARVLAAIIVGYAFSPIDLIPDPVPILGYLDDLVLLPLGIMLLVKIIPREILIECRARAATADDSKKPKNWIAGIFIIAIWIGLFILMTRFMLRAIQ